MEASGAPNGPPPGSPGPAGARSPWWRQPGAVAFDFRGVRGAVFAPSPWSLPFPAGLGLAWSCRRSRVRSKTTPEPGVQAAPSLAAPAPGWFPSGRVGDGRTATLGAPPPCRRNAGVRGSAPRYSPSAARPASAPFDQNGGCSLDSPGESAPARWAFVTLAVAYPRDGPISSTSNSTTVRLSPSRVSNERCRSRHWTTTRFAAGEGFGRSWRPPPRSG